MRIQQTRYWAGGKGGDVDQSMDFDFPFFSPSPSAPFPSLSCNQIKKNMPSIVWSDTLFFSLRKRTANNALQIPKNSVIQ